MLQEVPHEDTFVVSSSTALGMGEYLLALLNTVVQNLPESELRKMRDGLDQSLALADDLLISISLSSPFDALALNNVSAARGVNDFESTGTSSYTPGRAVSRTQTRLPVPPSSPAPAASRSATTHRSPSSATTLRDAVIERNRPTPERDFIISTRPNVGHPDYTHHPAFVQPGIPGPYMRPPVDPSKRNPVGYYVVTKGLYVGIFCNWLECSPWVTRIPGAIYLKVMQWEEARSLYNSRLATGACEVLL